MENKSYNLSEQLLQSKRIDENFIHILDGLSFEDWGRVEDARKELTFLFEEIESTFPLDEWDEDTEDYK
mgnify:CR=1 FL=1